jgi:hypothetical protein
MASAAIDEAHRTSPDQLGLPLTDLRRSIEAGLPNPKLFDPLVSTLCERDFVRTGTLIRRSAHSAALPAHSRRPVPGSDKRSRSGLLIRRRARTGAGRDGHNERYDF